MMYQVDMIPVTHRAHDTVDLIGHDGVLRAYRHADCRDVELPPTAEVFYRDVVMCGDHTETRYYGTRWSAREARPSHEEAKAFAQATPSAGHFEPAPHNKHDIVEHPPLYIAGHGGLVVLPSEKRADAIAALKASVRHRQTFLVFADEACANLVGRIEN